MKLARHKALDALICEYLIGTLRGAARRRFERALREEAYVSQRLDHWVTRAQLQPSRVGAIEPSPAVWEAIARDLNLHTYADKTRQRSSASNVANTANRRTSWLEWLGLRRAATLAAAVIVLAITIQLLAPVVFAPQFETFATLNSASAEQKGVVIAARSNDGKRLQLKADRVLRLDAQQSFEVWLLPKEGSAPISLAVIDGFDAQSRELVLLPALANRITIGAKLAISVEPRGGSKTGAPTGPVVFVGGVES
jgi:anti-sigma-K factor RskA